MSLFRRIRSSSKNYEELDKQYMSIEALEDGFKLQMSKNTILYSIDDAETWTELPPYTYTPAINTGDRIFLKADNVTVTHTTGMGYFRFNADCKAHGNVMSLCGGTLVNHLFSALFSGCSQLKLAPKLPATNLSDYCYYSMFYNCTGLTETPELPATTLSRGCYEEMFLGCKSLVKTSELPATTLEDSCYLKMFKSCTSLVKAPKLPATKLESECYSEMFNGCSKLNYIYALFTTSPGSAYTSNWVKGVASTGTFVKHENATWTTPGELGVPSGWNVVKHTDLEGDLLEITGHTINAYNAIGNDTTTFVKYSLTGKGYSYSGDIKEHTISGTCYSNPFPNNTSTTETITRTIEANCKGILLTTTIQQSPWLDLSNFLYVESLEDNLEISFSNILKYIKSNNLLCGILNGDTVTINSGDKIYFYGQWFDGYSGTDGVGTFSFSKQCKVGGNINSLVNANNTKMDREQFRCLFKDCNKLIEVEDNFLNYLTIKLGCYEYMFSNCTSLIKAPKLPATTAQINCYYGMFYNCTSLTTPPELPATVLSTSCYRSMFKGCTALTTAPSLPATTLEDYCYLCMFEGCSSLTEAPELPATTLNNYCCDSMFYNCSNLTKVPESLPATTLANYCYNQMFRGCKLLTTPPELPATTLADYCYASMFRECSSLNVSMDLPALVTKQFCYANMFRDCTSLTAFHELPATTLSPSCYLLMFYGCSNLTEAPKLPATTLASQCYYLMFSNTGLTKAPDLPAINLVSNCYYELFKNCSNLKQIYANFLTVPGSSYTYNWVYNVSPVGTFIKNYQATWDVEGAHGIPSGWDVLVNIEILSCSDLQITADNVSHSSTVTTIQYSAVCEVKTYAQEIETITITGTAISDSFDKNTDPVDKEVVITFTYYGVTAQTTIIQGAWKATFCELNLNDQWLLSSIDNPNTALYDGVYESFSNKGVNNSAAVAYITIEGYSNFKFYIKSYGESNYDYVMVSLLDLTITYSTSYNNTSLVKAHTRGKSTSETLLSNYTLVEFTGIDEGQHVITVLYRKDGIGNSGDDRGYLLIPKDQ